MLIVKDILNGIAFILTIILVLYGFQKGYDVVELVIYNLYFVVVIISQILILSELFVKD